MEENTFGLSVSQDDVNETPIERKERKPRQHKEQEEKVFPDKTGVSQNDFRKQPRYDIRIERQDGEASDIKVGVNGTVFQIWRGVVVPVPECVVKNLQNCIGHRLIQVPNPAGGPPENVWQEVCTVPLSVVRGPY